MDNLTPVLEDYLKAIYEIQSKKTVARVTWLSQKLKVKKPSVVSALKHLEKEGYINYERYGYITLTPKGEKVAKKLLKRFDTLTKFMEIFLQLDRKTAEEDACAIEHYLHQKTVSRVLKLIEFVKAAPPGRPKWMKAFKTYLETGKRECLAEVQKSN